MWQKIESKLYQIQESEEGTKKKWLIIMSVLSMIIVIALWMVLFKNSIIGVKTASENEQTGDTSFWQVFNSGLKSIGGSGWSGIKDLYSRAVEGMFIEVER